MFACLRPPPPRPLDSSYNHCLTLELFTEEFYRSTLQRWQQVLGVVLAEQTRARVVIAIL